MISKGICANGGRANRISLTGHANQEERPLVIQDHQVDMEEKVRFNLTGRAVLGLMFAGYVPLASQSSYPIIVYSFQL